jgi:hypothetical protein
VRRTALLATTAVLVVGFAACSDETAGDATPGGNSGTVSLFPTEGGGNGETSTPPGTSESSDDSPAASLQPCELLTAEGQAELALGPGTEDTLGGARICEWQAASDVYVVLTSIWENMGIDEVRSTTDPQPKTVGSHRAVQYTSAASTCAVALELTDSSRVDVSSSAAGDVTKACSVANQAAVLVEQELP